jgi:hypothetical protein
MGDITETTSYGLAIHVTGGLAIICAIISAAGVVFLIAMFAFFSTSNNKLGQTFGMLNDISVALQYLLSIPIALVLYRILRGFDHPNLIFIATILGIVAMITVVVLQLLLIFKVLTFEQQGLWVTLAMILGIGSWLVITGLEARFTGRLPKSVLISSLAVPYIGYPLWAFWLGLHLLGW